MQRQSTGWLRCGPHSLSNRAQYVEQCGRCRLMPCKDGEYNTNYVTVRQTQKKMSDLETGGMDHG